MRAALLAAVLAAGGAAIAVTSRGPRPAEITDQARRQAAPGALRRGPCPDGTLPDEGVCIPVPSPLAARHAPLAAGDRIPRRPERPEDFAAYRLPLVGASLRENGAPAPLDGSPPPAGVLLDAPPGTPVTVPELEGQEGAARVVYSGGLVGAAVVTAHTLVSTGRRSVVLVVTGNLTSVPPLSPGQELGPAAPLGATGSAPLYLETRLLRAGLDALALSRAQLQSDATSILVDPRNVLAKK